MASKLDELMVLADAYYHAPTPGTYPWDEIKRDGLRAALKSALKAVVEDATRWNLFTATASLGFDGAPHWNAVMRFPVFSHEDQTIAALVDRWASVYEETKRGLDAARKP